MWVGDPGMGLRTCSLCHPAGLPPCWYLSLEHSSLPLTFRGYLYSPFWSRLRLDLITSSRKQSRLPPGILSACSRVPLTAQPLRAGAFITAPTQLTSWSAAGTDG